MCPRARGGGGPPGGEGRPRSEGDGQKEEKKRERADGCVTIVDPRGEVTSLGRDARWRREQKRSDQRRELHEDLLGNG